jgi:hypothetical protein
MPSRPLLQGAQSHGAVTQPAPGRDADTYLRPSVGSATESLSIAALSLTAVLLRSLAPASLGPAASGLIAGSTETDAAADGAADAPCGHGLAGPPAWLKLLMSSIAQRTARLCTVPFKQQRLAALRTAEAMAVHASGAALLLADSDFVQNLLAGREPGRLWVSEDEADALRAKHRCVPLISPRAASVTTLTALPRSRVATALLQHPGIESTLSPAPLKYLRAMVSEGPLAPGPAPASLRRDGARPPAVPQVATRYATETRTGFAG